MEKSFEHILDNPVVLHSITSSPTHTHMENITAISTLSLFCLALTLGITLTVAVLATIEYRKLKSELDSLRWKLYVSKDKGQNISKYSSK